MTARSFSIARVALVASLMSAPLALAAQERIDETAVAMIKEEGYKRSQVMNIMSWLTDVYGPRLTNSPTTRQAGDWTVNTLKKWGLANVHYENFPFGRGWSNDRFVALAITPQRFPIIGYATAWTSGTSGAVTADLALATIDSAADMAKYRGKLRGKIVLASPLRELQPHFQAEASRLSEADLAKMAAVTPPKPMTSADSAATRARFQANQSGMSVQAKVKFYADEGVVAMVTLGRGDGGTVFVQSQGGDRRNPPAIPIVVMAAEHYGRLARSMSNGIPASMELDIRNTFHTSDTTSFNILAEIPGTDPRLKDEVVMLGAHFDSWHGGTGATDNAAGSAVMMEALRIIKTTGLQPRRTIRIGLWTGEEQGLLGSRAYVGEHFGSRQAMAGAQGGPGGPQGLLTVKPAQARVSAYYNVDNGTGAIRGVYLQGNADVAPIFQAWMTPFADRGMKTVTISNTGGTDHLAFDAVGIPGFQFIQDPVEYGSRTHHSNMDTYERVQADDMIHNAVVVAAFVWQTAQRDRMLPRKGALVQ